MAARGISEALESGAYRMDGVIINCMGMAVENILARPTSALSRNSDDFVSDKENGFAEHLLQNFEKGRANLQTCVLFVYQAPPEPLKPL